jgi:hypothetical protein
MFHQVRCAEILLCVGMSKNMKAIYYLTADTSCLPHQREPQDSKQMEHHTNPALLHQIL